MSIFALMSTTTNQSYFPAEWHPQSAIHLVWPSEDSDWSVNYKEVVLCYVAMIKALLGRQKVLLVFPVGFNVNEYFSQKEQTKMVITYSSYNDTWVRDYGGISMINNGKFRLVDFKFNAWGNKFDWELDNKQTEVLFNKKVFAEEVSYQNNLSFVLEGGSIDSNGKGLLLTSESCFLNPNRNGVVTKSEVEEVLQTTLAATKVLWLKHGKILGDDTDGHIDTLARFVDENTIVYVKCTDEEDEHFQELDLMEKELEMICAENELMMISLPMPQSPFLSNAIKKLPATYANFLIINGAVLVPNYECPQDKIANDILQNCFPDREIVSVNCLALIAQGGSLHCATMQYPAGFVK